MPACPSTQRTCLGRLQPTVSVVCSCPFPAMRLSSLLYTFDAHVHHARPGPSIIALIVRDPSGLCPTDVLAESCESQSGALCVRLMRAEAEGRTGATCLQPLQSTDGQTDRRSAVTIARRDSGPVDAPLCSARWTGTLQRGGAALHGAAPAQEKAT